MQQKHVERIEKYRCAQCDLRRDRQRILRDRRSRRVMDLESQRIRHENLLRSLRVKRH